jgi:hypothetical protein
VDDQRPGGGSAGSRRGAVIGGASTIFPGLSRPNGSNSDLTSRIAAYRGAPKTVGWNALRTDVAR